jgi:hypothetical protein
MADGRRIRLQCTGAVIYSWYLSSVKKYIVRRILELHREAGEMLSCIESARSLV